MKKQEKTGKTGSYSAEGHATKVRGVAQTLLLPLIFHDLSNQTG